mgnify:CR=1 FL=1
MEIKVELDIKDFILLCENTDREKICNLNIDRKEIALKIFEYIRNGASWENFEIIYGFYRNLKNSEILEKFEEEFQKLLEFNIETMPSVKNALYLYIFSYYARGMNFTDLAELKWSDLENLKFTYTRNKTDVNLKIKLPEKPIIKEILDFYKILMQGFR